MRSPRTRLETEVLQAISSSDEAIASFIERLVSIRTENPPGLNYRRCAEAVAEEIGTIGLEPRIVEIPTSEGAGESRVAVLASHGQGAKALYFHGHYDVVPASSDGQFVPARREGSLFGRGSSDMKGGLAAMIYAVNALQSCGVRLAGRVEIAIVPDEETGGRLGSRYLVDQGLIGQAAIGMLTPEPTSGVIWNANRGALSLTVTVKGRPAHVGLQHQGINAFERMIRVTELMSGVKRIVEEHRTDYDIRPEAARRSILLIGGRSEGGTNFNVVPAECKFTIDRRMNPEEDFGTECRRVFDALEEARRQGIDLEYDVFQEGRPSGTSESGTVASALAGSVEAVTGKAPRFEMCPGLLEIRFYGELGIPAFAYGPGILAVSHGPHEYVRLESVVDCSAIYAMTAMRLLS